MKVRKLTSIFKIVAALFECSEGLPTERVEVTGLRL